MLRQGEKNTHYSVTLQIDPIWFAEDFLGDFYDFYKQTMWNVTIDDMSLK